MLGRRNGNFVYCTGEKNILTQEANDFQMQSQPARYLSKEGWKCNEVGNLHKHNYALSGNQIQNLEGYVDRN